MGELSQGGQRRIFLLGSCVSRDIFEYDEEKRFKLVRYFASSALASATSPLPVSPSRIGCDLARLSSDFQRRVVSADLEKVLPSELAEADFDYLLTDFIDERFALFRLTDGALFTFSVYLTNTGVNPANLDGELIMRATDRYFEFWEEGWVRFVAHMRYLGHLDKVILNRAFWATHSEDGGDYLPRWPTEQIDLINRYLGRMYDRAARDLPERNILDFDGEFIGANSHRWGREPYHLSDAYYRDALARLTEFG